MRTLNCDRPRARLIDFSLAESFENWQLSLATEPRKDQTATRTTDYYKFSMPQGLKQPTEVKIYTFSCMCVETIIFKIRFNSFVYEIKIGMTVHWMIRLVMAHVRQTCFKFTLDHARLEARPNMLIRHPEPLILRGWLEPGSTVRIRS